MTNELGGGKNDKVIYILQEIMDVKTWWMNIKSCSKCFRYFWKEKNRNDT